MARPAPAQMTARTGRHRTAGQLHDGGGEEVEERRLAVEVEDAGERVVVQQPDVEQLIGVVQQAVVEPDAGGESGDAGEHEHRDDHDHGGRQARPQR